VREPLSVVYNARNFLSHLTTYMIKRETYNWRMIRNYIYLYKYNKLIHGFLFRHSILVFPRLILDDLLWIISFIFISFSFSHNWVWLPTLSFLFKSIQRSILIGDTSFCILSSVILFFFFVYILWWKREKKWKEHLIFTV